MLYNLLRERLSTNSDDVEALSLFTQYEKQRKHFHSKRISELKASYGLTEKEERILLGYFNTEEREITHDHQDGTLSFHIMKIFKYHKDEDELIGNEPGYLASLGWLRIYWSRAWNQFSLDNKYILSARFSLIKHVNKNQSESFLSLATEELIKDLQIVLPNAEKFIGISIDKYHTISAAVNDNGVLKVDTNKLHWLTQNNIGDATNKYIAEFKNIIEDDNYDPNYRLDVWDNSLYFSRQLALLRWKDLVEKLVLRKQNNAPALTYQFYTQLNEITKRETSLQENNEHIISKEGRVVSAIGKSPETTISTMEQITKSNLPLLASITSHYLWRWFIEQAHKQHLLDLEQPYKIELIGGYPKLAELSGAGGSREAISRIKKIIDMSSWCNYLYQGKTGLYRGNLLSFEYFEAYGRKSSKLTITLARPLCPGFVEELPDGNSKYNHQKMLIPWVRMPLLVGKNTAHHAPQSSFQLDLVAKMRLKACEIYERGGVLINNEDMTELAKGAKLSTDLMWKVIDAWVNEDYLERVDDCVYMLGKRYPEARESIFSAGEMTIKSAERGRLRKKSKNDRLRKKA